MSLIVFSGTVDHYMVASNPATGAALGLAVELFLTTWGLVAFRKGDHLTNTRISQDFEECDPSMTEAMQAKHAPSWMENLRGAKDIGDLKFFACSITTELFGIQLSDLEPIVDDVAGVATFVERAKNSQIYSAAFLWLQVI